MAETGILGLLSYMAIFGALYYEYFKTITKRHHDGKAATPADHALQRPAVRALWFVLPIAYLVQGIVLFDVLPIYINLFTVFAFSLFLFSPHRPSVHAKTS